jgi:hypothetical protein
LNDGVDWSIANVVDDAAVAAVVARNASKNVICLSFTIIRGQQMPLSMVYSG